MAALITIIVWLLVVVLALVGAVLITPVFVRVHLTTTPQLAYRIEVRALAGLAPRLTFVRRPRKAATAKSEKKRVPPKQQKTTSRTRASGSVVRAVPLLIREVLGRFQVTQIHIDADYGLSDPADTGQLSGLLMPLQYASPMPASVSVNLRPDFTRSCLNGSLTTIFRFTVAALLIPASRFAWRVYGPLR